MKEDFTSVQIDGSKLKEQRVKKGLTQKDIAIATGVTQASISFYENGGKIPSGNMVARLMHALKLWDIRKVSA